jgi:hypothetical protein
MWRGPRALARDTEIEAGDAAWIRVGFIRKQQRPEQHREKQGFHHEDSVVKNLALKTGEK